MKVIALPPNVMGVDTWSILSPVDCRALVNLGYKFREGYLGRLTKTEVQGQLGEGLPLVFYTLGNRSDPEQALSQLAALDAPGGAPVVYDLEALPSATDIPQLIETINRWADRLKSQSFLPCIYYAAGSLLTSDELYGLEVYRYHEGSSINRDRRLQLQNPLPRGTCLIQGNPFDFAIDSIPGKLFDADFHRKDHKGDVMLAVSA